MLANLSALKCKHTRRCGYTALNGLEARSRLYPSICLLSCVSTLFLLWKYLHKQRIKFFIYTFESVASKLQCRGYCGKFHRSLYHLLLYQFLRYYLQWCRERQFGDKDLIEATWASVGYPAELTPSRGGTVSTPTCLGIVLFGCPYLVFVKLTWECL